MDDLARAGIADPFLVDSFRRCRRLNAQHGRTYYLATQLLPPAKRPYVHALYGLARYADDIVDDTAHTSVQARALALTEFEQRFERDYSLGRSDHPVIAAAVYTALHWALPYEYFEAFFTSMRMDLTVGTYATYDDLLTYVYGSAAVIGLQMTPILEPSDDAAFASARNLGIAFQLANFIRDVGEDLDRDRIYLPLSELAAFGVSEADLHRRQVTDDLRAALAFQIARVRELRDLATPGIDLLAPECQPCIRTAATLYCEIVDAVEALDYQVFDQRARVSLSRRLRVAGASYWQARRARARRPLDTRSTGRHP